MKCVFVAKVKGYIIDVQLLISRVRFYNVIYFCRSNTLSVEVDPR